MRPHHLAAPLSLLLAACGEETASTPIDVSNAGGLATTLEDARLVVRSADGRVLLDGLPPGDVTDEAPPLVGFAVRDISTSYEMKFGSFKPTDEARGPWRVARRLEPKGTDALDLLDGAGSLLGTLSFSSRQPGELVVSTTAAGDAKRISWGIRCNADDHFAGFGAQTWDVDHRGQTVFTWVQENGIGKSKTDDYTGAWFVQGRRHSSHLPIPQFLARRGYALAVRTDERAIFALCSESEDTARLEFELGSTVELFDGPSPAEALERAGAALGRPRQPPRVAFAPWLDAIRGREEVLRVAKKLRDEKVPSSVIWSEDWKGAKEDGDGYVLSEEWEVDPGLYPDFSGLAKELHASGFAFHVYFNSFVYEETKAFAEIQPKGYLVKRENGDDYLFPGAKFTNTGLLDVFHEGARAWAVKKMRDAIALGADGWMHDFAEWLPTDAVTAAGSGEKLHNRYPVAWQEIAREAIDGIDDGAERLFFARSGWFGTPELADVIWAGDQRTSMDPDDGLPTILPIGIGLGLVGVSTYGHDIAGYQSGTNAGSTKEVFFRWTELGAWSPVMRTHHGLQASKNWNWEKDAETIAHFRRYAAQHMAMMPWLEGLAAEAHATSLPIWRGLFVHFPEDAATWPITDQVLVGSHVLVAPVQVPGATSRSVYLPRGTWYPWSGGAPLEGATSHDVAAPLDEIPVFARAGAIVPLFPDGVMTAVYASTEVPGPDSVGDDRVLLVFLGDSGSFREKGGLSYQLEHLGPATGSLVHRFGGMTLAACSMPDVAPCIASDEGGLVTLRLVGPGVLEVDGDGPVARIAIEGGAADRVVEVRLRRP